MLNKDIKAALEIIAPSDTQSAWDNSGMQICVGPKDVKKLLVAMEINDEVINEARKNGVDMIVTHHPLIFKPIRSIHTCDPRGRYIAKLIKMDIPVYSSHTPFDKAENGNTSYFMKQLGIKTIKTIPDTEGFLKIGLIPKELSVVDFIKLISDLTNTDVIKFSGNPEKRIKKVACCTGAGADFWSKAYKYADVLVTGDLTHHYAQYAADAGLVIIDAGHWGTEQFFVENMSAQLKGALGRDVEIIQSKVNQDPFNYVL